jgi:hypothetical protein
MPHFHKYIAMTTAGAGLLHTVALIIVYADKMVSWSDGLWSLDENGARYNSQITLCRSTPPLWWGIFPL